MCAHIGANTYMQLLVTELYEMRKWMVFLAFLLSSVIGTV